MKNLELKELSIQEMKEIEGGSWLKDAWNWVKEHVVFSILPSGWTVEG